MLQTVSERRTPYMNFYKKHEKKHVSTYLNQCKDIIRNLYALFFLQQLQEASFRPAHLAPRAPLGLSGPLSATWAPLCGVQYPHSGSRQAQETSGQ